MTTYHKEIVINKGDLFAPGSLTPDHANVIIHGCNAQGVMNSGFAKTVRQLFPSTFDAYTKSINPLNRSSCMGTFTITNETCNNVDLFIINLITQYYYGYDGRKYTSYDAVDSGLKKISEFFSGVDEPVYFHFPKIGCVRGGGEWSVVSEIIKSNLTKQNFFLNLWEL